MRWVTQLMSEGSVCVMFECYYHAEELSVILDEMRTDIVHLCARLSQERSAQLLRRGRGTARHGLPAARHSPRQRRLGLSVCDRARDLQKDRNNVSAKCTSVSAGALQ